MPRQSSQLRAAPLLTEVPEQNQVTQLADLQEQKAITYRKIISSRHFAEK